MSSQRREVKEGQNILTTMKWIQLAYCILVVNAVIAAIIAIVVRLTTRTGTEGVFGRAPDKNHLL